MTDSSGVYVDGTLGGGGHTEALLDALDESGRVVAIDQDDEALAEAGARLKPHIESGRAILVKGNFEQAPELVREAGFDRVDGLLLDLGVSSHQLDDADRGFSHRFDGPLDMRMDASTGEQASDIVNQMEVGDLMRTLGRYGEEPKAGRVAHAIVKARPIESTAALADLIRSIAPRGQESKMLARVFQALRIAVNDELGVLERTLESSIDLIKEGGRLAVISYHSLEDRRVKHFMRSGNLQDNLQRDIYGNRISPWKEVTRKPITADDEEIAANPRSRSARLRVAERLNYSS